MILQYQNNPVVAAWLAEKGGVDGIEEQDFLIPGYFENWASDAGVDRDLTDPEYQALMEHIHQHELYESICVDVAFWHDHFDDVDGFDDYDPSVMSEDLMDICDAWFSENIPVEECEE